MGLINNLDSYVQTQTLEPDKKTLFDSFLKKGFPTTKDEEWKYTSLKKIVNLDYVLNHNNDEYIESELKKYGIGIKDKIIFFNGRLVHFPEISGLNISNFESFNCRHDDALSELNYALAISGYKLIVDKNTCIKNPVEIFFFNSTKDNFSQYRNKILVGENSEIKIIENVIDLTNSNTMVNQFTQVNCNKNSKFEYNKVQNNTGKASLIDCVNIYQEKDSTCDVNTLIFGGGFVRNNLNFEQNGSNCESNMNGISLLDGKQVADNHTFVDHKNAHCRSNEMYKGIYLDKSKGVFNGKIMVRKDSQKIDAFQSNNNLLLSENSTIDSKPQLEIYADDVKCSHGCTIGQLDDDAIFYMRSRGVGINEAKAVLTYAFASEVIEKITIPELERLARELISRKLNVDLDFSI